MNVTRGINFSYLEVDSLKSINKREETWLERLDKVLANHSWISFFSNVNIKHLLFDKYLYIYLIVFYISGKK